MTKTLLSLGHGYSAQALARHLLPQGWRIFGTVRNPNDAARLEAGGVTPLIWPSDVASALAEVSHLLTSIAPDADGDPVLRELGGDLARVDHLEWVGYLSTTAVYGDHDGGWVDETTPLTPASVRGQRRAEAEMAWAELSNLPLHVFRLAGIYGPGRGPFAKLRKGSARRIIKKNQLFSRIHVDDIAQVLAASMAHPDPGRVYNVCDDEPAPPQDVLACAARLLGLPVPPEEEFATAEMSPMARSFYGESKRVRNDRIKGELGVRLRYPTYESGLRAILEAETA